MSGGIVSPISKTAAVACLISPPSLICQGSHQRRRARPQRPMASGGYGMPMSKNASTASCMMRVTSTAKWGGEKEGGNRERGEEGSCLGGWGSVWGSKLSGGGEQGSPPYSALPPSHRCTSQLQCPPYPPPPSHFPPAANYVNSLCPTRSNMAAAAFSRAASGRPRQNLTAYVWPACMQLAAGSSLAFSGLMAFTWVG